MELGRFDAVCAAAETDALAASKLFTQFSRELTLFEFQLARAATVSGANEREQENYAQAQAQLQQAIEDALGDIQALKVELEGARVERRQKEEYEARRGVSAALRRSHASLCQVVRKQCMQHPSRVQTLFSIAAVKAEIDALEVESAAGAARVEARACWLQWRCQR